LVDENHQYCQEKFNEFIQICIMHIAILDDYQNMALAMANWSAIAERAEICVFNDHISDPAMLVNRLLPFEVICIMRERTPLNRELLTQLPNLKLIVSTGKRNASLDIAACEDLDIQVAMTGYVESGAPELTWALLMALARKVVVENDNMRSGLWQSTIGVDLRGKTMGIVGLGRIGSRIAAYAKVFEMKVIAWSENLTEERAHRAGAELVTKERLFKEADFISIHLVLSERSRGIVGDAELTHMKPTAFLINTSRGPLVNEAALVDALETERIAGAALDVYDTEPLAVDHPFRTLKNVLATPHIGYVTEETYRVFYTDTVKAIENWLKIK
jgi:phosphoglycerate dehydrogenase-like enzyme